MTPDTNESFNSESGGAIISTGMTTSATQPCPEHKPLPKALVVDDDPIMLGLLDRYLTRAGYETITTTEAAQGVALALYHLPAIILMDVMMPDMSGLAALRLLRHSEATKNTPVIVISANDHPDAKRESLLGGAAAFLVKPFGLNQFLSEVSRAAAKGEEVRSAECGVRN